jgi:hypothetical protein
MAGRATSSLGEIGLPQCLRPSGEELRYTTQIAAHYGGLNCFRRLLPRGSEGGLAETPQINVPVKTSVIWSLLLIVIFFKDHTSGQ